MVFDRAIPSVTLAPCHCVSFGGPSNLIVLFPQTFAQARVWSDRRLLFNIYNQNRTPTDVVSFSLDSRRLDLVHLFLVCITEVFFRSEIELSPFQNFCNCFELHFPAILYGFFLSQWETILKFR